MLCVRAPKLEQRLNKVSEVSRKSKSYHVRAALEMYFKKIAELYPTMPIAQPEQMEIKIPLPEAEHILNNSL